MALNWITEPNDYSGTVGSTMLVEGQCYSSDATGVDITNISQLGSISPLCLFITDTGIIYVGGSNTGHAVLNRSTDGGVTWVEVFRDMSTSSVSSMCYSGQVFVIGTDSRTLTATVNIFKSIDGVSFSLASSYTFPRIENNGVYTISCDDEKIVYGLCGGSTAVIESDTLAVSFNTTYESDNAKVFPNSSYREGVVRFSVYGTNEGVRYYKYVNSVMTRVDVSAVGLIGYNDTYGCVFYDGYYYFSARKNPTPSGSFISVFRTSDDVNIEIILSDYYSTNYHGTHSLVSTDSGVVLRSSTDYIKMTGVGVVYSEPLIFENSYFNSDQYYLGNVYSCTDSFVEFVDKRNYTFNLKDNNGTSQITNVSIDGLFSENVDNLQLDNTGTWTLEAESGGETITSPFSVSVKEPVTYQSDSLREIPQGDPKMFITGDGMDIRFEGGIPVMDDGLENIVTISLGTKSGFALNKIASNGAEAVGSSFIAESLKSVTVDQIRILEDAAEKSLAWAVKDGLIQEARATVVAGERGYELRIVITPPTGENRILVYTKNGENWVNQKN